MPAPSRAGRVLCAAFTAFAPDLSVDLGRTVAHYRRLLDEGCDGLALLGTTGEVNSLSVAERRAVLEAALAAGVAPERLVPGTAACNLPETIELTRHALSVGVTELLLLPPFYYKPVSEDGLFAAYAHVIERVADDRLRVLLYHIPQMTGIAIEPGLIARLCAAFPGMIVGVKDSGGDLDRMTALVERFPGLAVYAGADSLLGPLLRAGGAGCITATANLIAPLLADLAQGRAPQVEPRIAEVRALFQRWPQIAALKAALAARLGDEHWNRVRPPLAALDAGQRREMRDAMAAADFA